MASVFEKPNFALSSERVLCACVALHCVENNLDFPFESCSSEFQKIIPSNKVFRRIRDNYKLYLLVDVPSVEGVPANVYVKKGFESAIYRNAFMAEMREQEFVPGTYTIGKIYYEFLEMIALEDYKTIEGFSASEMLLASAITGEHRLKMGKQNEERHKKAANHIREQAAAAVIADNSNRRLVSLLKELGSSAGEILSDHTSAFAEMVKRLCTSSQTRTQQHLYNLYRTEREKEPLDLTLYSHELQLAPLFGVKYCDKLRVFKFRDVFLIIDHLNKKSYILTMNHLDHLRSVTSWVTRLRYLC